VELFVAMCERKSVLTCDRRGAQQAEC
jgi:hypothetical protein